MYSAIAELPASSFSSAADTTSPRPSGDEEITPKIDAGVADHAARVGVAGSTTQYSAPSALKKQSSSMTLDDVIVDVGVGDVVVKATFTGLLSPMTAFAASCCTWCR